MTMTGSRRAMLAVAGVLLPISLAFAGYLVVSSLGASADSVPLPVRPTPTVSERPHASESPGDRGGRDHGSGQAGLPSSPADDHGGRCSEPEHLNDPSCSISATPSSSDRHGGGPGPSGSGSSPTPS